MRKLLFAALALLLVLPTISCDSSDGDGGEAAIDSGTSASGLTAGRTAVAYNKWVNAKGLSVPYSAFGIANVSAGRGRALPEGVRVIVVTPPAHGTLSRGNTFYKPTADYVGVDFFTFKLADASGKVYPDVYTMTFKKVDAEPPAYVNAAQFSPSVSSSPGLFFGILYNSPGGLSIKIITSQKLEATTGSPVLLDPVVNDMGADNYFVNFYGDFTVCASPGNWSYEVDVTLTDPAGNTVRYVGTGLGGALAP